MSDLKRLPPGQHKVSRLVAMPPITGKYPHIGKKNWKLQVYGEVKNQITWNWQEFLNLPQKDFIIDFHCVTHWSKLDHIFTGVSLDEI